MNSVKLLLITFVPLLQIACQQGLESCGRYNPFLCAAAPEDTDNSSTTWYQDTWLTSPSTSGPIWSSSSDPFTDPSFTATGDPNPSETGFGSSESGFESICGDFDVSGDETCDDGNTISGDGCSFDCQQEPGPGQCFDADQLEIRSIVPPQPGDLVITEVLADPDLVIDPDGEWIEVWANTTVDLNGLKILDTATPDSGEIAAALPACQNMRCLTIPASGYALFALNADADSNGGLPEVDCIMPVTLANAGDGISIANDSTLLHGIEWTMAQTPGRSTTLDPAFKDPMYGSTDVAPWCTAVDAGTPKQENPPCP